MKGPRSENTNGFVRVAVPTGVEGTFTYKVPAGFGRVEAGTRVLVPFGKLRMTGLVVEQGEEADVPGSTIRAIEDVLDVAPSVPAPVMALARFVSDYYACPLGETLKAAHPGGPAGTLVARLSDEGRLALAGGLVRGKRQGELLQELSRVDMATSTGLRRRIRKPGVGVLLRELAGRGWVTLSERLSTSVGEKVEVEHVLSAAGSDAEACRLAMANSPVRADVLEAIRAAGGEPVAIARVVELSGRPLASVRAALTALVEAGLLRQVRRVISRRPSSPEGGEEAGAARRPMAAAQAEALAEATRLVDAAAFDVLLIEGVTGSGKTEVYLRALAHAIALGRTGLYLVPEIALTPILLRTVRSRFGARTAILHSRLTPGERHDERARILAGEVDVVLGARSAVFAPLPRLGLIVVDEEHESSYKQDSAPRYHGRDVAVVRGRIEGCPVILGSATPSLESYQNAVDGKYRLKRLPERAGGSRPAKVEIVDMREEWKNTRSSGPLSRRLRTALDATLAAGRQAIMLLNRRGWADFLICRECGGVQRCDHCSVSLTIHLGAGLLQCHYCDMRRAIPERCGTCNGTFLQQVGQGTEQLETTLRKMLPGISMARLDADVARSRGAADRILSEFEAGRTSILLGTQIVAKAHDFPGVTLVGVLQADRPLWMPDFRASERTFQLVTQVAGRAGRRREQGIVIVQSFSPDHPALKLAARQDYPAFFEAEAEARRALAYPPFSHLTAVMFSGEDQERVHQAAVAVAACLRPRMKGLGSVIGPAPAPILRIKDKWRFQLLAKSVRRKALSQAVRAALAEAEPPEGVSAEIDVDAQSLL